MSDDPKSTSRPTTPAQPAGPAVEPPGAVQTVTEVLGISRVFAVAAMVAVVLLLVGAIYYFIRSAPPTTIVITSGPEGSMFQTNALKYVDILARHGVKVEVLTSRGSDENLQRLSDPSFHVDVGFTLGGMTNGASPNLVSLGSISHQPLLIFYRGAPVELLSDFAGKQLAI